MARSPLDVIDERPIDRTGGVGCRGAGGGSTATIRDGQGSGSVHRRTGLRIRNPMNTTCSERQAEASKIAADYHHHHLRRGAPFDPRWSFGPFAQRSAAV